MGDLPMFESRVCFHTRRQHSHPGTTGAGSEPLPTKREKPPWEGLPGGESPGSQM